MDEFVLVDQEQAGILSGHIKQPWSKAALGKHPVEELIAFERRLDFCGRLHFVPQGKENRRIHWLDMELAFAGKDLMILVVYRHYIDFGIAVEVIQPIGTYTGWRKWNFPVSAQVRKTALQTSS